MPRTDWNAVDFRPAPPGWRVLYLDEAEESGWAATPLAGWYIEEEQPTSGTVNPDVHLARRVVAADHDYYNAEPSPIDSTSNFWRILGPNQPDPTADETAAATAKYKACVQRHR